MEQATIAPLRILVGEDNALIGALLADLLTAMGHDVCAVETTETDMVSSAARHRPDLLIADNWLRDGSGVTAVERILLTHIMPYIFVTGDHASIRLRMPDAVILEKPFSAATLQDAICKVLRPDASILGKN